MVWRGPSGLGGEVAWLRQEPLDELDPDEGAAGAPAPEWDPLPMLGQFWEDPEPVVPEPVELFELPVPPELELEVPLVPLVPDVVLVLVDPEFPVDDEVPSVVLVELVPEPDVEPEVVAAFATAAPPATRPEASAPAASMFRKRMCIGVAFLGRVLHPLTRADSDSVRPRPVGNRTFRSACARSSATNR
jgi:hypothetical protein